ncbi:uncharacterized protein LOC125070609 isoform X1 [Vanessa atalanta]|uniref:uncharacterized protein LOC125070609 isoform X1 n=1 Tax=Vanessa atalanta TaxID=42275 RepID=UPI001FCCD212|nr:uncharacterized protein LOC125070609 isoform X1 [Vanessa atalanta]
MANDEVLGPRKTMFVLVIVVGCFAVLWPRILSPLILGHTSEQLKPNKFDRETGCCEVLFEREVAVLELLNEVCSSALGKEKFTPQSVAQCRKAVNDTCGLDIAAFVKRNESVGKTTRMLLETMKKSNSSCLKQHFGVPIYSLSTHFAANSWTKQDTIKQERSPIRMGPHPALLERGRAIPPGPPPPARPVVLPPHVRVRSPLSVYYDLDIKPPPIPGMRPPLGSPGGPVPAPKSSMGFVMPIYTICIIVFFVYTLSKILFKRTGAPFDPVAPDPQFRRRVFRDDSRTSPDKLGHKETDTRDEELAALKARLAETERAMQRIVGQLARRDAEALDNARPYTNGTVLLNSGPYQIVASEYNDPQEKTPVAQKDNEAPKKSDLDYEKPDVEVKEAEKVEVPPKSVKPRRSSGHYETIWFGEDEVCVIEPSSSPDSPVVSMSFFGSESNQPGDNLNQTKDNAEEVPTKPDNAETLKSTPEDEVHTEEKEESDTFLDLFQISEGTESSAGDYVPKLPEDFLNEVKAEQDRQIEKEFTPLPLAEIIENHRMRQAENMDNIENQSVKVVGMEMTAHPVDGGAWRVDPPRVPPPPTPHKAEDVKSIFLDTEIPQQSRVLVSDFAEDRTNKPKPNKNAPLVVRGKMTLSLIQDAPRYTPDRDLESTFDDYTTASGLTQPAAEREDDLSEEEIEEEIEVEEIEEIEEIEEDEEEEEEEPNYLKK